MPQRRQGSFADGILQAGPVRAAVDWPQFQFTQVASGISTPTSIVDPRDGSGRLFVTEQGGRVILVQSNSNASSTNLFSSICTRAGRLPSRAALFPAAQRLRE